MKLYIIIISKLSILKTFYNSIFLIKEPRTLAYLHNECNFCNSTTQRSKLVYHLGKFNVMKIVHVLRFTIWFQMSVGDDRLRTFARWFSIELEIGKMISINDSSKYGILAKLLQKAQFLEIWTHQLVVFSRLTFEWMKTKVSCKI